MKILRIDKLHCCYFIKKILDNCITTQDDGRVI